MSSGRLLPRVLALFVIVALTATLAPACSLGDGKGQVDGELNIPDCWSGNFDLKPDFFAAIPYRQTSLIIRIQNGGDYETFSDGVSILVDDLNLVRNGLLGQRLKVALPASVTPPGVPVKIVPDPARVHLALYLQRTCRIQVDALYAVDEVSLNSQGQCADEPASSGLDASASVAETCNALGLAMDAGSSAGADAAGGADAASPPPAATSPMPTGQSWIRFNNLFNGISDESDAQQRLNDGDFEVYLADPREVCPGGVGPPPKCRGHLKGSFTFYFQRGKPAQPFP